MLMAQGGSLMKAYIYAHGAKTDKRHNCHMAGENQSYFNYFLKNA